MRLHRRGLAHVAVATALGLVVGAVTQLAGGVSDSAAHAFAASTGPWVISAALTSRLAPSRVIAAAGGAVLLWAATAVFYLWPHEGSSPGVGTAAFWVIAIVVIGPVLGVAGFESARTGRLAALAVGLVAGWLLGEALYVTFEQDGGNRWLVVVIDALAALSLLVGFRGPRRLAFSGTLVATAGPLVFLAVVELLVDTLLR